MTRTPTFRDYEPRDLAPCRALWRSLTERHRELYADPSIGGAAPGFELDAYLTRSDLHRLWVAEHGAGVVGLCGLLVAGEEAELEPIVVDPEHRHGGLGSRLAQHAVAEARRLGARYVNVRPVARNLEAIRFFHREGFRLLGRYELSIALEGATAFGSRRTTGIDGLVFDC